MTTAATHSREDVPILGSLPSDEVRQIMWGFADDKKLQAGGEPIAQRRSWPGRFIGQRGATRHLSVDGLKSSGCSTPWTMPG